VSLQLDGPGFRVFLLAGAGLVGNGKVVVDQIQVLIGRDPGVLDFLITIEARGTEDDVIALPLPCLFVDEAIGLLQSVEAAAVASPQIS